MRQGFVKRYEASQTDDFYYAAMCAKREGQKTFSAKKLENLKKDVYETKTTGEAIVLEDAKTLGAVRLRHTSTSQPLVAEDPDFDFSIPFDKDDAVLEQRWNSLLELEDLIRHDVDGNQGKVNTIIRYIVHSLQFNTSSTAVDATNPEAHKRFAHVLNDAKGQKFVSRFMDIMPSSFLKRFFFTSFIVFKDVNIDSNSKFACDFLKGLVGYVSGSVKPKWIAAFLRDAVAGGFAHIAASHFKSACVSVLLAKVHNSKAQMSTGDAKLLETVIRDMSKKMTNELSSAIRTQYNSRFMNAMFTTVMAIVPDSELPVFLRVPSL